MMYSKRKCSTVPYNTVQNSIASTVLYFTMLQYDVQYSTAISATVYHCNIKYSTVH